MDRLTIRNGDGSVSQPTDLRWTEALNKLAAYEDTGLSPEECAEYAKADKEGRYIVLKDRERQGVDRLREIAKADVEGRLIVLPCKVGDAVWNRELEAWKVVSIEWFSRKVTQLHCVSPVSGRRHTFSIGKRSLGKTVFLTREEAEKALEAHP